MGATETERMNRFNIFVVEDHEIVRDSFVLLIERMPNLRVCGTARSAEEALTLIAESEPDLVLVDVLLPGMDGLRLTAQLRRQHSSLPILVITGHDNEKYRVEAEQAGADGLLFKHEGPDLLIDAIYQILS